MDPKHLMIDIVIDQLVTSVSLEPYFSYAVSAGGLLDCHNTEWLRVNIGSQGQLFGNEFPCPECAC